MAKRLVANEKSLLALDLSYAQGKLEGYELPPSSGPPREPDPKRR